MNNPEKTTELTRIDRSLDVIYKIIGECNDAQTNLKIVIDYLIKEAIGEGRPDRNITEHPDYKEALRRREIATDEIIKYYTKL